MEYSASVSGCPANCVDPDAPATCISPTTEGCACKDGYLLSGNECVKKEQCGCVGPDQQYYPVFINKHAILIHLADQMNKYKYKKHISNTKMMNLQNFFTT